MGDVAPRSDPLLYCPRTAGSKNLKGGTGVYTAEQRYFGRASFYCHKEALRNRSDDYDTSMNRAVVIFIVSHNSVEPSREMIRK